MLWMSIMLVYEVCLTDLKFFTQSDTAKISQGLIFRGSAYLEEFSHLRDKILTRVWVNKFKISVEKLSVPQA